MRTSEERMPLQSRRENRLTANDGRLKLGLFAANCAGGGAITTVPERWEATWDNNLALAQMADSAGLELMLPVARWVGYGGSSNFQGTVLETISWAAGLLASTRDINVFSTVHTAFSHPIVAAKQLATADHIGRGRLGLNVVCGWNKPEYEMFGYDLPGDHTDRYAFGQEWLDIVRRVWTDETPSDWHGQHFQLKGVVGEPKPVGGTLPPILNAGSSTEGRDFAARNSDFLFTSISEIDKGSEDLRAFKSMANLKYNRDVRAFTTAYVVCRPTRAEAEAYHHYYAVENADTEAVDRLMSLSGLYAKSFPPEVFTKFKERFAGGHGVYPLIGSPDDIADELERIYQASFSGVVVNFVNYLDEFPYFRDEVLPRLAAKGIR